MKICGWHRKHRANLFNFLETFFKINQLETKPSRHFSEKLVNQEEMLHNSFQHRNYETLLKQN